MNQNQRIAIVVGTLAVMLLALLIPAALQIM